MCRGLNTYVAWYSRHARLLLSVQAQCLLSMYKECEELLLLGKVIQQIILKHNSWTITLAYLYNHEYYSELVWKYSPSLLYWQRRVTEALLIIWKLSYI